MENNFRADLHCHSLCSDGSHSPEQILLLAQKEKLSGISITDHDTLDAYTLDIQKFAKELNIYLLAGVEISSTLDNKVVHILAYGNSILSDNFRFFLKEIQQMRDKRNKIILEKLNQIGFKVTEDELYEVAKKHTSYKGKSIGRPHIAMLMKEKGYVDSIQSAFDNYLGDKKKCYAAGMRHTPHEVINEIHASNGVAVIAHPHFYRNNSFTNKLLSFSFDGIECYYSRLDSSYEKRWIDIAKSKNMIITGGSDFHGSSKPHINLGCSWVDKETFFRLYE